MFRICLATLVVALAATSAQAAMTVDGSIADWQAAGLWNTIATHTGPGAVTLLGWGGTVVGNTFYGALQMDRPVSDFDGTTGGGAIRRLVPSAQIDGDHNASTAAANLPGSWAVGSDMSVEWGRGVPEGDGADPYYNYWGTSNDLNNIVSGGVPGGSHADSGSAAQGIVEFSAPVQGILYVLANYGNGPYGPRSTWNITMCMQGTTRDRPPSSWGYDYGPTVEITAILPGDANVSGDVTAADLTTVLANYGKTGQTWYQGDSSGDGSVSATDLTSVLANYGKTLGSVSGGSPVPEPSSIVLLATLSAMIGAWVIRRRNS